MSRVTELEDGWSEYKSWESYYGVLATTVQKTLEQKLKEAFEAQGEDLRVWAETGKRRGG